MLDRVICAVIVGQVDSCQEGGALCEGWMCIRQLDKFVFLYIYSKMHENNFVGQFCSL